MATKAQIQSLITADLASGVVGGILAIKHRNVLKDDANSILEAVYSAIIEDTEAAENITTSTGLFDYSITVSKAGRLATITGTFKANVGLLANSSIFQFSDLDFATLNSMTSTGFASSINGNIRIYMLDNHLRIGNSVLSGEQFNFTITYPVKD